MVDCNLISVDEAKFIKQNFRLFQIEFNYWISCFNVYQGFSEYPEDKVRIEFPELK